MADAEAASPLIQLVHVHGAHLLLLTHVLLAELVALQGLQIGQELAGEGFVVFKNNLMESCSMYSNFVVLRNNADDFVAFSSKYKNFMTILSKCNDFVDFE